MKKILLEDKNLVETFAEVLKAVGVVMHPTETCYGFAVDVFNEQALQKLCELKGRDANKPISILVADLKMAQQYGEFSEKALLLAKKYWPGPLTIIVPRKESLPRFFNRDEEFVGIRCSSDKFCKEVCAAFGGPVTTTSANLAGQPSLYEADTDVFGELAKEIDLVVDGGKIAEKRPSTIVRVAGDELEILRQGDLVLSEEIQDFEDGFKSGQE